MEYLRLPAKNCFFLFRVSKIGNVCGSESWTRWENHRTIASRRIARGLTVFTESLNQLKRFWSVSKMFFLRGPSNESDRM